MAAKLLPSYHVPGAIRIAKVTVGMATDSPDVSLPTDASAVALFKVPPGVFVKNIIVHKTTAFGSSGAMTVDIGDTDADGFIESTDLVATDAGVFNMGNPRQSTGIIKPDAYLGGKLFTSDDSLDTDGNASILLTVGTAPANAGFATVYVEHYSTVDVF